MTLSAAGRLLVVSNRLPVVLREEGEKLRASPGQGGLVTALTPVLGRRGGLWLGWPGIARTRGLTDALRAASGESGYQLVPVQLEKREVQGYYYGFANEILWPLLHGFETRCHFDPSYWQDYESANRKFAAAVAKHSGDADFIWIHDYHLMLVGSELRRLGHQQLVAFFLHIPFPPPDVFYKLPWRAEILRGLLAFDLVGFQTTRDRRNFTQCLQQLRLPDLRFRGRGSVIELEVGGRHLRTGAFPISIDYAEMSALAASREVAESAWLFHERLPGRQVVIGMDRLDYTKGIPERLRAFRTALEQYPELRRKITLVQVTVPSREGVPEYEHLRADIERLVGEINGQFTKPGDWVPVHYIHRSIRRDEVCTYLRAAEIGLVTPLRDGMNLVAKEFIACDVDKRGVLILSEFAGAAAELKRGALLVNPYDFQGMAAAICEAFHMAEAERRERMTKLRDQVRRNDIYRWVNRFLEAAVARQLDDSRQVDDLIPEVELGHGR